MLENRFQPRHSNEIDVAYRVDGSIRHQAAQYLLPKGVYFNHCESHNTHRYFFFLTLKVPLNFVTSYSEHIAIH